MPKPPPSYPPEIHEALGRQFRHITPKMATPRKKTRERKDVTLPKGLYAEVQRLLGGRGISALVSSLLLQWLATNVKKK